MIDVIKIKEVLESIRPNYDDVHDLKDAQEGLNRIYKSEKGLLDKSNDYTPDELKVIELEIERIKNNLRRKIENIISLERRGGMEAWSKKIELEIDRYFSLFKRIEEIFHSTEGIIHFINDKHDKKNVKNTLECHVNNINKELTKLKSDIDKIKESTKFRSNTDESKTSSSYPEYFIECILGCYENKLISTEKCKSLQQILHSETTDFVRYDGEYLETDNDQYKEILHFIKKTSPSIIPPIYYEEGYENKDDESYPDDIKACISKIKKLLSSWGINKVLIIPFYAGRSLLGCAFLYSKKEEMSMIEATAKDICKITGKLSKNFSSMFPGDYNEGNYVDATNYEQFSSSGNYNCKTARESQKKNIINLKKDCEESDLAHQKIKNLNKDKNYQKSAALWQDLDISLSMETLINQYLLKDLRTIDDLCDSINDFVEYYYQQLYSLLGLDFDFNTLRFFQGLQDSSSSNNIIDFSEHANKLAAAEVLSPLLDDIVIKFNQRKRDIINQKRINQLASATEVQMDHVNIISCINSDFEAIKGELGHMLYHLQKDSIEIGDIMTDSIKKIDNYTDNVIDYLHSLPDSNNEKFTTPILSSLVKGRSVPGNIPLPSMISLLKAKKGYYIPAINLTDLGDIKGDEEYHLNKIYRLLFDFYYEKNNTDAVYVELDKNYKGEIKECSTKKYLEYKNQTSEPKLDAAIKAFLKETGIMRFIGASVLSNKSILGGVIFTGGSEMSVQTGTIRGINSDFRGISNVFKDHFSATYSEESVKLLLEEIKVQRSYEKHARECINAKEFKWLDVAHDTKKTVLNNVVVNEELTVNFLKQFNSETFGGTVGTRRSKALEALESSKIEEEQKQTLSISIVLNYFLESLHELKQKQQYDIPRESISTEKTDNLFNSYADFVVNYLAKLLNKAVSKRFLKTVLPDQEDEINKIDFESKDKLQLKSLLKKAISALEIFTQAQSQTMESLKLSPESMLKSKIKHKQYLHFLKKRFKSYPDFIKLLIDYEETIEKLSKLGIFINDELLVDSINGTLVHSINDKNLSFPQSQLDQTLYIAIKSSFLEVDKRINTQNYVLDMFINFSRGELKKKCLLLEEDAKRLNIQQFMPGVEGGHGPVYGDDELIREINKEGIKYINFYHEGYFSVAHISKVGACFKSSTERKDTIVRVNPATTRVYTEHMMKHPRIEDIEKCSYVCLIYKKGQGEAIAHTESFQEFRRVCNKNNIKIICVTDRESATDIITERSELGEHSLILDFSVIESEWMPIDPYLSNLVTAANFDNSLIAISKLSCYALMQVYTEYYDCYRKDDKEVEEDLLKLVA